MRIRDRIRHAVVKALWGTLYEGAQWSDKRGWPTWPQPRDARFDVNPIERTELVRRSRGFEANNAIVNRLADLYEQFTVGPNGLQIIADSSDEDWNLKADARFNGWCRFPDLTSRLQFSALQSQVARSWFIDGEVFIRLTYGSELQVNGKFLTRPRIELIESHRVATPGSEQSAGRIIHDGIEVDGRGRPIAYWVRDSSGDSSEPVKYRPIEASRIIHIYEPSRPGQMRGLPFLYPVMNDLHDLDELQAFAKTKAKENSSITRILETESGEFPTPETVVRKGFQQTTENSRGVETTEEKTRKLQNVFGARAIALKSGEKLTEHLNNTPSVADRELWSILTSRICIGVGIPKILVFPESIQGTVARGEYDVANAFFRSRSSILAAAFTEVWLHVMSWETQNTLELSDPPEDWTNVFLCPPRAVNVDVGYNSAATLADVESGLNTYRNVFGTLGKHWRTELRQKAAEAAYIQALATEFKVEKSEISTLQQDKTERIAALKAEAEQRKQGEPQQQEEEEAAV